MPPKKIKPKKVKSTAKKRTTKVRKVSAPKKKPAKKTAAKKSKKAAPKRKPANKKPKAKKPVAKKKSRKKKKSVARKSPTKKPASKKRKAAKRQPKETLFILEMSEPRKVKRVGKPKKKVKAQLPALDLDKLTIRKGASVIVSKPGGVQAIAAHQHAEFYLGVFFGVIVVHVFLAAFLAVYSV